MRFLYRHRAYNCYRVAVASKIRPSLNAGSVVAGSPNKRRFPMLLRDHPLMMYRGCSNWPPVWSCTDGHNQRPKGEVGTLKEILRTDTQPPNRCFLLISHQGSAYLGCLLFDDPAFCKQITQLLRSCCNRPISEIGSLDLSHTL